MATRVTSVSEYVKTQPPSEASAQAGSPERAGALVTTPISRTNPPDTLHLFPRSVRIKRFYSSPSTSTPPDRSGSQIIGFSDKSRSRLRFTAVNASPALISQMGLTYHEHWPTDGREAKHHLETFLRQLRRWVPSVKYLWLLEFQKRNAPHFHLFLTIPPDPVLWSKLSRAWVKITGGTDEALWWHGPERGQNWIAWEINNGNYLCKYLDKEAQKSIPEGYVNFGRFWGNSLDLVPDPLAVPLSTLHRYDQLDQDTGEVISAETYIIRNLGRLAERQTNGYSRFRTRAPRGSYTILNGTRAFFQLERYLGKSKSKLGREVIPDDCPF